MYFLPVPRMEARFLGISAHNLVTILTALSRLPIMFKPTKNVCFSHFLCFPEIWGLCVVGNEDCCFVVSGSM